MMRKNVQPSFFFVNSTDYFKTHSPKHSTFIVMQITNCMFIFFMNNNTFINSSQLPPLNKKFQGKENKYKFIPKLSISNKPNKISHGTHNYADLEVS